MLKIIGNESTNEFGGGMKRGKRREKFLQF
jgi:hypothetical protein